MIVEAIEEVTRFVAKERFRKRDDRRNIRGGRRIKVRRIERIVKRGRKGVYKKKQM